mmetsp:Transcript_53800/g.117032  ORF Transcript_53800/g.117032 Transcript_53800/m.117032 type:complete len:222 (-) Transcript_53800:155-820(-)
MPFCSPPTTTPGGCVNAGTQLRAAGQTAGQRPVRPRCLVRSPASTSMGIRSFLRGRMPTSMLWPSPTSHRAGCCVHLPQCGLLPWTGPINSCWLVTERVTSRFGLWGESALGASKVIGERFGVCRVDKTLLFRLDPMALPRCGIARRWRTLGTSPTTARCSPLPGVETKLCSLVMQMVTLSCGTSGAIEWLALSWDTPAQSLPWTTAAAPNARFPARETPR